MEPTTASARIPPTVGKRIALALIEQHGSADKLAGIFVLHELLGDHLRATDLAALRAAVRMPAISRTARSSMRSACKVLGTLLQRVRGRAEVARALATWRNADTPWQRRAACAAFTALAPHGDAALPGLAQLIFRCVPRSCGRPIGPIRPRSAGCLRELSRGEPTRVEAFVRRHARFMSRECARLAVEKLPRARRICSLHWKRATSLRRS